MNKQNAKFNQTIKIYRTDVEKMKSQIEQRVFDIWNFDYFRHDLEEYFERPQVGNYRLKYTLIEELWAELCLAEDLMKKADALLSDESFDFIYVDADEWFEEWYLDDNFKDGLLEKYYMLPDSDETDEIFEKMKTNYKYTITDLFGFYRFYPLHEEVVIA